MASPTPTPDTTTPNAAAPTTQTLTPEQCSEAFSQTVGELLDGLSEIFPECPGVAEVREEFTKIVAPNPLGARVLIRTWHESMEPLYGACHARDAGAFLAADMSILKRLGLNAKWNDPRFNEESKRILWTYIDELNTLACGHAAGGMEVAAEDAHDTNGTSSDREAVFQHIPHRTAENIRNISAQFAQQFQTGDVDMSTFNPLTIGQQIASSMTEAEMDELRANIPALLASLQSQPEGQQAQAMMAQNPQLVMSMISGGAGAENMMGTVMSMMNQKNAHDDASGAQ